VELGQAGLHRHRRQAGRSRSDRRPRAQQTLVDAEGDVDHLAIVELR
jgi:hypothetical protein